MSWRADRGWWLGLADLQARRLAPGGRLDTGVDFLWHERDHVAYAADATPGEQLPAYDVESFAPVARALAQRAHEILDDQPARWADLEAVAGHLLELAEHSPHVQFDAGVAYGLLGRLDLVRHLLAHEHVVGTDAELARRLAAAGDVEQFREAVYTVIEAQRSRFGLPRRSPTGTTTRPSA